MADYSKQYCEICDPGLPWDFDLEEEFSKLEKGYALSIICEGLGIYTIAVETDGSRHVLVSAVVEWDDGGRWIDYNAGTWIEYENFLENFKTKHENNVNQNR